MQNKKQLELAMGRAQALAHKLRIKIINYLLRNPNSQVKEIYTSLGIEQSVCSQHLKILRDVQLVTFSRTGKNVRYTINYDILEKVAVVIHDFLEEE